MKRAQPVERRVYNLPQSIHRRILAFKATAGHATETDAAIALLKLAFLQMDTAASMADEANEALKSGRSYADVIRDFCEHPHVRVMQKDADNQPPRWWEFTLVTGEAVRVDGSGAWVEVAI